MQQPTNPARRQFVLSSSEKSVALLAAATLGTTGCSSADDRALKFGSLTMAEQELAQLAQAGEPISHAVWNWSQTLTHCAQSIEYSMSGFPQSKSKLFQSTLGSAALGVFMWRGRMTHDLAEPIAGAPALDAKANPTAGLERLRSAMLAFAQWQGPLRPHFAYGELSKKDYELAHAMHIANHLSHFRGKA